MVWITVLCTPTAPDRSHVMNFVSQRAQGVEEDRAWLERAGSTVIVMVGTT